MRGWPLLGLLACGGSDPAQECTDAGITWQATARPFLSTWCTPCHSSTLPTEERLGAPVDVNYDSYSAVARAAPDMRRRLEGQPTMPPSGGLPLDQRDTFVRWLDCGLPRSEGAAVDDDLCADAARVGDIDATAATCADGALVVEGSLTVRVGADLDCICDVAGDLLVRADAAVALGRLTEVGGTVRVEAPTTSLSLPVATTIGGLAVGASTLTSLVLPRLDRVGGDVVLAAHGVDWVALDRIRRIDGALHVVDNPVVATVRVDRLEYIGGDLILRNLEGMRSFRTTHGLEEIGGAAVFEDLPLYGRLEGHSVLHRLGGGLRLVRTGVTHVRGFDRLLRVPGTLHIDGNPNLATLNGLADVLTIDGDLVLRDNDALVGVDSFVFLEEVGGDFVIEAHTSLESLPGFTAFSQVGGNVRVVDNPALPTDDVSDWVAGVDVGGTVTIEGNAP